MPGDVAIPVETRCVQPASKRPVVFEPVRHLLRAFVPPVVAVIVALAAVCVPATVVMPAGITTIIVGVIISRRAMMPALLIVGYGFWRLQEQETTGQD